MISRLPAGQAVAVRQALALLAALVIGWSVRAPYMGGPFSIDEYTYVTAGREVLHGELPLSSAWLDRSPAGALLYSLPLLLPLELDTALDIFALAFSVATAFLLFRLLMAHAGELWGWFALLGFSVLSADPALQANGANMEIPINFLLVATLMLGFPAKGPARPGRLLLAGLTLGLAVALKETIAIFAPLLLVAGSTREGARVYLRGVTAGLAGLVLPYGLIWVIYAALGQHDALLAVSSFHVGYASLSVKDLAAGPLLLLVRRGYALFALWPLAVGAIWYLGEMPWKAGFPLALRLFVLCAAAAVVTPGYFFAHYYLLLLPPCVLASALWLSRLGARGVSPRAVTALAVCLLACPAIFELRMATGRVPLDVQQLSPLGPVDFSRRTLGKALAGRADDGDRLLVFGGSPTIYAHAALRPAAPDIWGLTMGSQLDTWAWSMKPWLVRRTLDAIARRPPEWIVVTDEPGGGEVDRVVQSLLDASYDPVDLGVAPGDGSFHPAGVFHRRTPVS